MIATCLECGAKFGNIDSDGDEHRALSEHIEAEHADEVGQ